MKTCLILMLCFAASLISCKKAENGPRTGEDYIIMRWLRINIVDSAGNNLLNADNPSPKQAIFLRESVPPYDTIWQKPNFITTGAGTEVRHNYIFQMANGPEDYKGFLFDYRLYVLYGPSDVDTIDIAKRTRDSVQFYWNGRLKGTIAAMDTAKFVYRITK